MIIFEDVNISPDKSPEENVRIIKSWAGDLVDKLNMLSEQIDDTKNKVENLESEVE